ncbi:MAG: deoxynucleoside kinase [Myxococcales bacterium]|nr:deoxynucleoside kinase [Myxococcales bacterium]
MGRARFVAVAGNIGAGKSTLTAWLAAQFRIQPFYESNDANPYLTDFYADMARFAFHSQMYFLSAKFRAHLELARCLGADPQTVFVQDRTIYEDAEIFARTLHTRGVMDARDFQTYLAMYEGIRAALPKPDLLIFLRCSLRGLHRRIAARGRPEEQAIDPKYLGALQRAYEAWFERYDLGPKMVIETEQLDYLADVFDRQDLVSAIDAMLGGRAQAFAPAPRAD